jgi:putative NADH-flavin reductase
MKVLVIGATRGIGREMVAAAHAAGHEVTLLARNAERISLSVTGVRVVVGDAGDADDMERAVAGQDAVVWTVGVGPTRRPVHLFSRSTQFLLAAMAKHGVRRLICVTGIGAGDSRGHGGFFYDRILQPLFMKSVYEDKDRQEALLRASDVDWTIVRPGSLTNGPATGLARALTDLQGVTAGRVSRADVAEFIVLHLETGDFRRTAVLRTSY